MTLKEFLAVCCEEDYVGIWDISSHSIKRRSRNRFEVCPTPQNYFKVENIPYGRIRYLLDKDVLYINHTEKGILVRLGNKEQTRKNLDMYALASEIAKCMGVR